jgi:hypothetical protein
MHALQNVLQAYSRRLPGQENSKCGCPLQAARSPGFLGAPFLALQRAAEPLQRRRRTPGGALPFLLFCRAPVGRAGRQASCQSLPGPSKTLYCVIWVFDTLTAQPKVGTQVGNARRGDANHQQQQQQQ